MSVCFNDKYVGVIISVLTTQASVGSSMIYIESILIDLMLSAITTAIDCWIIHWMWYSVLLYHWDQAQKRAHTYFREALVNASFFDLKVISIFRYEKHIFRP